MFEVNKLYSRKDVRKILGIIDYESIGGIWSTGYAMYENNFFIFAGIEVSGRTGHNYNNILEGNILKWSMKGNHKISSPTGRKLLSPHYQKFIFIRESNSLPFKFIGYAEPLDHGSDNENWIHWEILNGINDLQLEEKNEKDRFKAIDN